MKTHQCRAACAVEENVFSVVDYKVGKRLCGDVGDPVAGGAARITKLQSKNRSGQVMAENTLVQAVILVAETLEERGNSNFLVGRARKKGRESARGEAGRDFGK